MFEVGKTYTAKNGHEYTCIAVNDTHAWLSGSVNDTAYVWDQNGKALLGPQWDIKPQPRDFWIYEGMVTDLYHANAIHVREVLPE